jgi:hypothetical protein
LILRGIKTIEVRVVPTNVRGTIYLYAAKKVATGTAVRNAVGKHALDMADLPLGMLVGTVEVVSCRRCRPIDATGACVPAEVLDDKFGWQLANPSRLAEALEPRYLPYGVWFYPFERRNGAAR